MTISRLTLAPPGRSWIPLAAIALCAAQLLLTFPGELITDSREQLREAISHDYLDWHPPVMALVWSWLLKINGNYGLLLVLQQTMHWLGFGLVADGMFRARMPVRAWLTLAAGAFPVFLFYDRELVKDVGMGSGLVAGFGLVFWFIVQRKAIPVWAFLLSGVCILYGTLIRTNAIFAVGPLLTLYFTRGRSFTLVKIVACSVVVAIVALPLTGWINHKVIGAKSQDALRSLQIFDLMGIAVRSGDYGVLGKDRPPDAAIKACYTSYWWDPYSPWGKCSDFSAQIEYIAADLEAVTPYLAERSTLWRQAILHHPPAYLAHRLAHFNSSIYFFVPAVSYRYSNAPELDPQGGRVISKQDIFLDYLKKNFLFWPVMWLALGLCALAFLPSGATTATVPCAQSLIVSGLLYGGAYFFVSVATETRYYYWSMMAIMLAVVLASAEMMEQMRQHPRRKILALTFLVVVLLIGLGARIADVPLL